MASSVLNDKYSFNYKYVCLFTDLINFREFDLYLVYTKNGIPILKVFKNDSFIGLIMPISLPMRWYKNEQQSKPAALRAVRDWENSRFHKVWKFCKAV